MSETLEKEILSGFIKYLNEIYPEDIFLVQLFGSRARGNAHSDSDYDILIVVSDRSKINRSIIYDYVLDINLKYNVQLSLKIYSLNEFENQKHKGIPFIKNALEEGYALWSR